MGAANEADNNEKNFNIILDRRGLLNVEKQRKKRMIKAVTMKNNLELFFQTNKLWKIQLVRK